jgi:UDP-N-acetylmuramyl pentapeptide synthase
MKRSFLAFLLKLLSKWAVKKHKMKIIVVAGLHGTKITGELIARMLQPDFVVRRQLEGSFWDFSIPLAILGVEDKKYGFFQWIEIIVVSLFRLVFTTSNSTWTILQMNTYKEEITSYWMDIIEPDITAFVNVEGESRKLDRLLISNSTSKVIISDEFEDLDELLELGEAEKIVVGKTNDSDLTLKFVKELNNGVIITIENSNGDLLEFFAFQKGLFMINPITVAVSTLLAMGIDYEEVKDKLIRTEIDLERFLHNNSK